MRQPTFKREKLFGEGRSRPLDRNAKVRVMHLARMLVRRTSRGNTTGGLPPSIWTCFRRYLWGFHNAKSGRCFPSLARIAEAAGCARSQSRAPLPRLRRSGHDVVQSTTAGSRMVGGPRRDGRAGAADVERLSLRGYYQV